LAGGGGGFSHPGLGPRKIGGIYESGYSKTPYKVLDIKKDGEHGFLVKVVDLPHPDNQGNKVNELFPRWHSTWWDHKEDKILHDPDPAAPGAPLQTQKKAPVYAPRSVGDSADPYVRALNRLSEQSPNNVAKLLMQSSSPIRRLLDAHLGARPIHSTGTLIDQLGNKSYRELDTVGGHLPDVTGRKIAHLSPERRAALNRVMFEHLYRTRN
jgi:hypothetical protein